MITSGRQLSITKKKIESLKDSLKKLNEDAKEKLLVKAPKIQTQVLIEELESEVFRYEELKTKGDV